MKNLREITLISSAQEKMITGLIKEMKEDAGYLRYSCTKKAIKQARKENRVNAQCPHPLIP